MLSTCSCPSSLLISLYCILLFLFDSLQLLTFQQLHHQSFCSCEFAVLDLYFVNILTLLTPGLCRTSSFTAAASGRLRRSCLRDGMAQSCSTPIEGLFVCLLANKSHFEAFTAKIWVFLNECLGCFRLHTMHKSDHLTDFTDLSCLLPFTLDITDCISYIYFSQLLK